MTRTTQGINQYRIRQLLLILSLTLPMAACSKPTAEVQIRQHIDAMQQALEEKDASSVLEHLDQNFQGSHQLDYQQAQAILLAKFLRHQTISVALSPVVIEIDETSGEKATMRTTAVVTGGARFIPDDGRIFQITGEWHLRREEWLLYRLEWQ